MKYLTLVKKVIFRDTTVIIGKAKIIWELVHQHIRLLKILPLKKEVGMLLITHNTLKPSTKVHLILKKNL